MLSPASLRAALHSELAAPRWWLGLSGGMDSLVLLHLLAELDDVPRLGAIHVHHGLSAAADRWQEHCRRACVALGVEFVSRRVAVEVGGSGGRGVEAAARTARYGAFAEVVGDGEVLLLAHHRDDQLETLLMRLLRGAGVDGLAGMPARRRLGRGRLVRPLLDISRAEIVAVATERKLNWIEDPSNSDTRFDRNFVRARLLPLLAQRWPDYPQRLQRSLNHLGDAQTVLDDQASLDLVQCGYSGADHSLALTPITLLSAARQRNLLLYWLRLLGLPLPPARGWVQWSELLTAQADTAPCWRWGGVELRRFRGRLYPLEEIASQGPLPRWQPPATWSAQGVGELRVERAHGQGLRTDRDYHICLRQGGERCKPAGRQHSQTLKKLLQEYAVAPWWRDRLPLVFCGDRLAAVADYWVCSEFEATADAPGWRLRWSPPGILRVEPARPFC